MTADLKPRWADYKIGMTTDQVVEAGIQFKKREWDLGSERIVGKTFSEIIPTLISESRFHPQFYEEPRWIEGFQGGINMAHFKIYKLNQHERTKQIRKTGSGKEEYWQPIEVRPGGQMDPLNNPLLHQETLKKAGLVIAISSKVVLNNLSIPGTFGGYAHFPLIDIVHAPTEENVAYLIDEIKARCELEKFLVLRSSDRGMMIVGPELVDEEHYKFILNRSLQLNHMEVASEFWVDDRWVSRSQENFIEVTGNKVNPQKVAGILRAISLPPIKNEEPTVIAASF